MASEIDQLYTNYENLKLKLKESFERIYATLKARELKTSRQLDKIMKHCQDDEKLRKQCMNDIKIRFDNESILINSINDYGAIDFENLNLDSNIFNVDDEYISSENDNLYSNKELNGEGKKLVIKEGNKKQFIESEHCSCCVKNTKDASKQENTAVKNKAHNKCKNVDLTIDKSDRYSCGCSSEVDTSSISNKDSDNSNMEPSNEISEDSEVKKMNPTDDWLNSIKNQTEIEPTYFSDGLEHSDISCL